MQSVAMQCDAMQCNAKRSKANQSKVKHSSAKQSVAAQSNAKQSKAVQSIALQSEAKTQPGTSAGEGSLGIPRGTGARRPPDQTTGNPAGQGSLGIPQGTLGEPSRNLVENVQTAAEGRQVMFQAQSSQNIHVLGVNLQTAAE